MTKPDNDATNDNGNRSTDPADGNTDPGDASADPADGNTDPGDASADPIGYADAMAELDSILAELDDDGIDIDVLSERVERAAELIAVCRSRISAAQARVSSIVDGLETDAGGAPQVVSRKD